MTQTIKWLPSSSPNIVAYDILISDTGPNSEFTKHATVLHQIPGTNYSSDSGYFFFEDEEVSFRYYRLRVLDAYGNTAEDEAPTPFKAGNNPVVAPTLFYIALDHNRGGQNNLQYVTEGGSPIDGATIRVYKKVDWDTRNLTNVIGTTVTATGAWSTPVFVTPGETYTIVLHKPNEYGPDISEITV